MKPKLDKEAISNTALKMAALQNEMVAHFPATMSNAKVLKNLAASAIHFIMFMKDFYDYLEGDVDDPGYKKMTQEFLDHCGCKND